MKKSLIILLVIISISLLSYFYLPSTIDSHWDQYGNVNGTMSKFWGIFLIPFIAIFIYAFFLVIPKIDPVKKIKKTLVQQFSFVILLFFLYIQILIILVNLDYSVPMDIAFIPAIAFLFFYIGHILPKTKRNYFIGIRTPWTLSSDKVWKKTHKLGGLLFKACGIVMLLTIIFSKGFLFFVLVPILLSVLILLVYSYLIFKNQKTNS